MTMSLAAVFIPIVFMGGIVGRLLHEFAVTIIIAIVCLGRGLDHPDAHAVRPRAASDEHGEKHNAFYRWSEAAFNWMQAPTTARLRWSLGHSPFILGVFAASIVASIGLFWIMPQDFLPSDDTGRSTARSRPPTAPPSTRWSPTCSRSSATSSTRIPMSQASMLRRGRNGAGANSASLNDRAEAAPASASFPPTR